METYRVEEVLRLALDDSDPEVRKAAAEAVDRLEIRRDVETLLGQLESGDPEVRVRAVYGLGGIDGAEARRGLRRALTDTAVEVRAAAVRTVLEHRDPHLLEPLLERLDDPEGDE